jgi:hypothetical protein
MIRARRRWKPTREPPDEQRQQRFNIYIKDSTVPTDPVTNPLPASKLRRSNAAKGKSNHASAPHPNTAANAPIMTSGVVKTPVQNNDAGEPITDGLDPLLRGVLKNKKNSLKVFPNHLMEALKVRIGGGTLV